MNAAAAEDREFLLWQRMVQKRAILPLKWVMLATAVSYWLLGRPGGALPPVGLFALFVLYFMWNVGESYFFWVSKVGVSQVRPSCLASYAADVAFVTALVYLDGRYSYEFARLTPSATPPPSDFYVYYLLLILRGFALFPSPRQNFRVNAAVGCIFILTLLVQDAAMPLYSSPSNIIHVIFLWLVILMSWFIVEILNRQKAEAMRARENMVRSENMVLVGELAAGVAHEINNPIGIISVYAEYLKKSCEPGDPRLEDIEAIHKESQRCKDIVAQLLNYARPVPPVRVETDLRLLADEVLDFLFRHTAGPAVRVERVYDADLPAVLLDPNQARQALLNVLLNARQAMAGRDGRLEVRITHDPARADVVVEVGDNGAGIAPENLRKVFDPFFTSTAAGTGLGLSITRRIVESFGGSVEIAETSPAGTRVRMRLPVEGD